MTEPFTGEEVWKACKQLLMLRKLKDESGLLDTFELARLLDPNYPEWTGNAGGWAEALACTRRVIPALELLEEIEVIKVDDIKDTWTEFRYWDIHPEADKFLKRHDAGQLHAYLLDCKVRSYSMSPGVKK